jgi:acetyl-CoA acetyltransferase
MSVISGLGLTAFGRHEGMSTLDLMSRAAALALTDGELSRTDIDAVICGYSTTFPHLMLADAFAEHFGLQPRLAHGIQAGGATAGVLLATAHQLVEAGLARHVLVVAGENRLTGQSRGDSVATLAQVGHPVYEVPLGANVPAYYALIAARYLHEHGLPAEALAPAAVLMRRHAGRHPGAHFRAPISVADVARSRLIATPLRLLDCCPISDGAGAVIVSRAPTTARYVTFAGTGQAHTHQHVSAAPSLLTSGAAESSRAALAAAGVSLADVDYLSIYDSFTITLTLLLEQIGFAPAGQAPRLIGDGYFSLGGELPLNLHGGLLSYGHSGVAGAFAHIVEAGLQLTGMAQDRQVSPRPSQAFVHVDGGVMSAHVSVVLRGAP